MTRDDLYGHYRRYYIPNNATLVIVGDVETDAALRLVDHHFAQIPAGHVPPRQVTVEPEQTGERRVTIRRPGTTAYLKAAFHAPGVTDERFYGLLVLDAVLTGAYGLNLWSSFALPPPQRSARLYRALVQQRIASSVSGSLLPTEQPFVYIISATATEGTPLAAVEEALTRELDVVAREGITDAELAKAKAQLKARLVFDNDSVTNIAHQLGYFETIAGVDVFGGLGRRIAAVTREQVATSARILVPSNRTIGWFDPEPVS
jgi:zinc protease